MLKITIRNFFACFTYTHLKKHEKNFNELSIYNFLAHFTYNPYFNHILSILIRIKIYCKYIRGYKIS